MVEEAHIGYSQSAVAEGYVNLVEPAARLAQPTFVNGSSAESSQCSVQSEATPLPCPNEMDPGKSERSRIKASGAIEMFAEWLDQGIQWFTEQWPRYHFFNLSYNVYGLIAILLVSLVCGAVSSLVVGNRMAFFSSALTHSAFAGVSLGFLLALISGAKNESEFYQWLTPVMVGFGVLVGIGIAWVREKTSLASDTVIGVFNAGALGFGALLLGIISRRKYFSAENFLFGSVYTLTAEDLIHLIVLSILTAIVFVWLYNEMVFTSFNQSLARTRGVRVRLCNYIFIALLAMVINVCLKTVGVLLVHALLIVPAATAAHLCRNLRQLFWWTIILCTSVGILSQWISWQVSISDMGGGQPLRFSIGGVMVVLSVILFFASMALRAILSATAKRKFHLAK